MLKSLTEKNVCIIKVILSASNSEFKKALEVNTCRSTAPLTMSSSYDQFNFHRKIYSYVSKYREKKIPFLKILTFSNSVIFLDCLQLEFNVCVCVCVPSNINKKVYICISYPNNFSVSLLVQI